MQDPGHIFWGFGLYLLFCILASQSYFYNDDTFNYNYGQVLAATCSWKEVRMMSGTLSVCLHCVVLELTWPLTCHTQAEEAFLLIQSEDLKNDYTYLSWLSRCCTSYQLCEKETCASAGSLQKLTLSFCFCVFFSFSTPVLSFFFLSVTHHSQML